MATYYHLLSLTLRHMGGSSFLGNPKKDCGFPVGSSSKPQNAGTLKADRPIPARIDCDSLGIPFRILTLSQNEPVEWLYIQAPNYPETSKSDFETFAWFSTGTGQKSDHLQVFPLTKTHFCGLAKQRQLISSSQSLFASRNSGKVSKAVVVKHRVTPKWFALSGNID